MQTYTPPPGYYDLPFIWAFDAANLTDGINYLNNLVYIKGGYGPFIMRRVVGLSRILNPTTGQYQIRDRDLNNIESVPVFGISADDLGILPELIYPETGGIRFDLLKLLRPAANPWTAQVAFQGVRRMPGTVNNPTYKATPKTFTYTMEVQVNSPINTVTTGRVLIDNYDFELHQLIVISKPIASPLTGLAASFDFYPDSATLQESYFEQNTGEAVPPGSPEIIAGASLGSPANNESQGSPVGPYIETPTVRYQILIDPTTFVLRAMKSSDNGATWAEVDTAHHPAVNDNADFPPDYTFYATARDSNSAVKKVYCAFWDTDDTVSEITFNMDPTGAGDAWGPIIKSTLTYSNNINITPAIIGFSAAFRPSDGAFIIGTNASATAGGYDRSFFAKFSTTGLAWDANWTACGDTSPTDHQFWWISGMVVDPNTNNVHFQFQVGQTTPNPSFVYHQVLHADNSLTVPDLAATVAGFGGDAADEMFLGRPIGRTIPTGGIELLFTWRQPNGFSGSKVSAMVARAVASDTPAWTIEIMATATTVADDFDGFQLVNVGDGTVKGIGVIGDVTGGGSATWNFVFNPGPGMGWTLTPFATTLTSQTAGRFNGYLGVALGAVLSGAGAAAALAALITPVSRMWLYDQNKIQVSNEPVLDLFMDGGPNGVYKNGAVVTPLWYRKDSQIQIDFYSQIATGSADVTVYLVGKKFYPCA